MDIMVNPSVQAIGLQGIPRRETNSDNDAILEVQKATDEVQVLSAETRATNQADDFPEGGREAWLVVFGAFMLLFPSFGFMV